MRYFRTTTDLPIFKLKAVFLCATKLNPCVLKAQASFWIKVLHPFSASVELHWRLAFHFFITQLCYTAHVVRIWHEMKEKTLRHHLLETHRTWSMQSGKLRSVIFKKKYTPTVCFFEKKWPRYAPIPRRSLTIRRFAWTIWKALTLPRW